MIVDRYREYCCHEFSNAYWCGVLHQEIDQWYISNHQEYGDYSGYPISYCPFCGEKVECNGNFVGGSK